MVLQYVYTVNCWIRAGAELLPDTLYWMDLMAWCTCVPTSRARVKVAR